MALDTSECSCETALALPESRKAAGLDAALDRIRDRFGSEAVRRGTTLPDRDD